MRWFCRGKVVEWDAEGFDELLKGMGKERVVGTRAVVVFKVWKGNGIT
jgi:hypothetical protein